VAEPTAVPARGGNRGMGRGLAAILSSKGEIAPAGLREVPVELVQANPQQPRTVFDAEQLTALAESIKARGVLQPIVVRPLPGGAYELIAGERRLRAAKLADLTTVPAVVRDTDEQERLELALIENMARADLNPVEEARACATLVDDLGLTKEELGRRVGRSRAAVSNLIRLLELPDEVLGAIGDNRLSEGHGRALLRCKDHSTRRRLGSDALAGGWSVRETEERARLAEEGHAQRTRRTVDVGIHPDLEEALAAAEDALSAALGREVKVRARNGAYRVEFELEHATEGVDLAERILRRRSG
jgi:ParB family transcriptional regulator, chromosome partitioning protein